MAKGGINVSELRRQAEAGELAPVYLVVGEEQALRRRAAEALMSAFESAETPYGGVIRMDGDGASLAEVLDEARSLPLFAMMQEGASRLVWVSRVEAMEIEETEELKAYLEAPVRETCLAFEASKLDGRKAASKLLAKHSVTVDCAPLQSDADARRFVQSTCRTAGHKIEPGALVYLTEMAGTSLTALENELEKAMLYAGEAGTIRAADMEGLLGRSREHSVFELTDALVGGNSHAALRVLNRLLDDGEEPLRVLAMIAWITRQLVIAHDLASAGSPRKQVLNALAGRWNQRETILARANRAQREPLVGALASCGDADLFVKRLRDTRPGADKLRPARGRLEALCREICAA